MQNTIAQQTLPFGLLFADLDMRTQGFVPPPFDVNYDPTVQRAFLEKYSLGDTGTWGSSTTFRDRDGDPNGSDEDAMRDD